MSSDDEMDTDGGTEYDNLSEGTYQLLESPIRCYASSPGIGRVASFETAQPPVLSQGSDFGEDTFAGLTRSQLEEIDPARPDTKTTFIRSVSTQEDNTDEDEDAMLDDDVPTRLRSQRHPVIAQPSPRPPILHIPPPPSRTTTTSSTTTNSSNDSIFSKRARAETPDSSQEENRRASPRQKIVHSPVKPVVCVPSPSKTTDSSLSLAQSNASVAIIHPKTSYAMAQLPFGVTWIVLFLAQIQPACWEPIERLLLTPEGLSKLRESHAQAVNTLCGTNSLFTTRSRPVLEWFKREEMCKIFAELDWEDAVLAVDPYGALGGGGVMARYGGSVHFTARLAPDPSGNGLLTTFLLPPKRGPSCKLARRFGSDRILRLRVGDVNADDVAAFLRHPLVLENHVFELLLVKDDTAIMLRTDMTPTDLGFANFKATKSPRLARKTGISCRLDRDAFLKWYNIPDFNGNQMIDKYIQRTALILSASIPGPKLKVSNIRALEEICSERTGAVLSDGVGLYNRACAAYIRQRADLDSLPTATQVRVAGAKGLLVRHPDYETFVEADEPVVWIRPSQLKIVVPGILDESGVDVDEAFLTIDILRTSHIQHPSNMAGQLIVALAENGVPHETFITMMEQGVEDLVGPLAIWDGPLAMENLRASVEMRTKRVSRNRSQLAGGAARARGFIGEFKDPVTADQDTRDASCIFDPWRPPRMPEDQAADLLAAGFSPLESPDLFDLLRFTRAALIDKHVKDYEIPMRYSLTGFIVIDDKRILKPGQCFIRSSHPVKAEDGHEFVDGIVRGMVLVTRYPCMLPSDVRKLEAIAVPELMHLTDVVVLPALGDRSIASEMSGGDYDGDKVVALWHTELVEPFDNSDKDSAMEPSITIKDRFIRDSRLVSELVASGTFLDTYHQHTLIPLHTKFLVGTYSVWHMIAVYEKGYGSEEALYLAHMFATLMDASKSGLRLKEDVHAADRKRFSKKKPAWMPKQSFSYGMAEPDAPKRDSGLGKFVLDALNDAAIEISDRQLAKYETLKPQEKDILRDESLSRPFLDEDKRANKGDSEQRRDALRQQKQLVEDIKSEYSKVWTLHLGEKDAATPIGTPKARRKRGVATPKPVKPPARNRQSSDEPDDRSLSADDKIAILRQRFQTVSADDLKVYDADTVLRLRASYAYNLCWHKSKTRFAFTMAFHQLCLIKATDRGPASVSTMPMQVQQKSFAFMPED